MWAQNIWVGVSVESQEQAWRIDELAKVPAAVRFVSAEPLLGPLVLDLDGIDWVIAGGRIGSESPHDGAMLGARAARPMFLGRRRILLQTVGRPPA